MKSNKKALIIVSSLVILGVGGYFLYTYMKKKKMEKDAKIQADELDLANTWIRNAKGVNSSWLTFDDEFKIALWKANISGAVTFTFKGKTFTKGGKAI
jgi:hypothetical protein